MTWTAEAVEEVQVRRLALDLPPGEIAALAGTLSPDEAARADRFRREDDRRRFVAARGLLRRTLGSALGRTPQEITFEYGPRGKPRLAGDAGRLRFNLSHAGPTALVALAWGREVGVDIEIVRPDVDAAALAARFLPAADAAVEDAALDAEVFFRAWVRHEAYLKAWGVGFSAPPPPWDPARWSRFDLDVGPGAQAALVVEGRGVPVHSRLTASDTP